MGLGRGGLMSSQAQLEGQGSGHQRVCGWPPSTVRLRDGERDSSAEWARSRQHRAVTGGPRASAREV